MSRALAQPLTNKESTLSLEPERFGWLEPTDSAAAIPDIRARYKADGCVWLKGLLNRDDVLAFRRRYFEQFPELLEPGTDPVDGILTRAGAPKSDIRQRQADIVRWAAYESFCLAQPLWQFFEAFLGGPVYLHKRKLLRHTLPGGQSSTGAHYDLIYLRAGTDQVVTAWIPIGDITVEMGGLIYLEKSDAWGREMEADFAARNASLPYEERISAYNKNMAEGGWLTHDLPELANRLNARWLAADYEAGDVMLHSAYMIHAAPLNLSPDNRMRLSTDIRYQRIADAIDPRWGEHWGPNDNL